MTSHRPTRAVVSTPVPAPKLNAWLSDYAQREPIYKLDPAVAGVLGALQVQSAQVKNGKLVVTFNQNLGNLVPAGVLGK